MSHAYALIIIPTYNESGNMTRLLRALDRLEQPELEILVVDDNSPDGTADVVARLKAQLTIPIHLLKRSSKQGLGNAYKAGIRWALQRTYQLMVSMDADGSHDPADVVRLIRATEQEADIALGSKYVPGGRISGWSWDRHLLSRTANVVARLLLGLKTHDVTSGFKCYRRRFLESLDFNRLVAPGYAFQVEMITAAERGGFQVHEIPIHFRDRTVGRSKVSRHELHSSIKSLGQLVLRRRGLRQITKFSLVGSLNLLIDLGITNSLVLGLGVAEALAGYLGVGAALINSFIWNRRWTFRVPSGRVGRQFGRFVLINGSGALLHSLAYTLLLSQGWYYNWAKLGAIALAMGWNFFGTKYWVFKPRQ